MNAKIKYFDRQRHEAKGLSKISLVSNGLGGDHVPAVACQIPSVNGMSSGSAREGTV